MENLMNPGAGGDVAAQLARKPNAAAPASAKTTVSADDAARQILAQGGTEDDVNEYMEAHGIKPAAVAAPASAGGGQGDPFPGWPVERGNDAATALPGFLHARFAVGAAKTADDKLATLKEYYPGAILRQSGGPEFNRQTGTQIDKPRTAELLIPDPEN